MIRSLILWWHSRKLSPVARAFSVLANEVATDPAYRQAWVLHFQYILRNNTKLSGNDCNRLAQILIKGLFEQDERV